MPPETDVKDVDIETETEDKVNDGKVDMSDADSETAEDSSTEKTEGQEASGKDEKTTSKGQEGEEEVSDDKDLEDAIKKGASIPYERFKQWNDKSKLTKTELESLKAEQGEVAELLNNPTVFRAILQAKGITDPKILDSKMKEAGFEAGEGPKEKSELYKQFSQGLDLSKQESWFEVMERMVKHFSKEALNPIEKKLSEKDVQSYILSQETEAKKIAKDVYGIEYGQAKKDEGNINTAVGKMWAYIEKHPEHAHLGHSTLIHLALGPEGIKLGEEKGIKKEKERHKSLKSSAMEDDAQVGKDEIPNADWPVSKLMAYRRKYGK